MEFLAISGLYRSADAANDTPLSLRSPYVTPSDANKNLTAFTVERHQNETRGPSCPSPYSSTNTITVVSDYDDDDDDEDDDEDEEDEEENEKKLNISDTGSSSRMRQDER
ncbi:hypothetical protein V1478_002496 [Vespula squamosa]|uniref:Uncharacterized protein n=1 Tax=Vespula squamosa TaxID=30214 RepID=A0ABD2BSQ6_VESSQ